MAGLAGMFLFLSSITISLLIRVQPVHGMARAATLQPGRSANREKHVLQRMLGISEEVVWAGGIANPRIRHLISGLHRRQLRFSGMRQAYIGSPSLRGKVGKKGEELSKQRVLRVYW